MIQSRTFLRAEKFREKGTWEYRDLLRNQEETSYWLLLFSQHIIRENKKMSHTAEKHRAILFSYSLIGLVLIHIHININLMCCLVFFPFPSPHSDKSHLQGWTDWLTATSVTQTDSQNEISANPKAAGGIKWANHGAGGWTCLNTVGLGKKTPASR